MAESPALFQLHSRYNVDLPGVWLRISANRTTLKIEGSDWSISLRRLPGTDGHPLSSTETEIDLARSFSVRPVSQKVLMRLVEMGFVGSPLGSTVPLPGRKDMVGSDWVRSEFWPEMFEHHRKSDLLATEILNSFCWRLGVPDGSSLLRSYFGRLRFTFEKSKMLKFPVAGYSQWEPSFPPGPDDSTLDAIITSIACDIAHPLHFTIFQEADRRKFSEPRVALIMAVVAAETGIKSLISDLQPETAWILSDIPSPPVVKLLNGLPRLPARESFAGKVLLPPLSVRKSIREAVDLRNALAHGKAVALDEAKLETYLADISDFLRLLDYYAGAKWSLALVRPETLAAMENEARAKP